MDIQALSMDMAQDKLMQGVGTRLEKMAMNSAEDQGAALMQLLEPIADPALANNVDIRA